MLMIQNLTKGNCVVKVSVSSIGNECDHYVVIICGITQFLNRSLADCQSSDVLKLDQIQLEKHFLTGLLVDNTCVVAEINIVADPVTNNIEFVIAVLVGHILKHNITGGTVDVLHAAACAFVEAVMIPVPVMISRIELVFFNHVIANGTYKFFRTVLRTSRFNDSFPIPCSMFVIRGFLMGTVAIGVGAFHGTAGKTSNTINLFDIVLVVVSGKFAITIDPIRVYGESISLVERVCALFGIAISITVSIRGVGDIGVCTKRSYIGIIAVFLFRLNGLATVSVNVAVGSLRTAESVIVSIVIVLVVIVVFGHDTIVKRVFGVDPGLVEALAAHELFVVVATAIGAIVADTGTTVFIN